MIELDVRKSNCQAFAFYRALGFMPPAYALLSLDRLNCATNRGFQRLALRIAPRPAAADRP
ncbi:hypothetical protein D3C83_323070 [compost metagenome]